MRHSVACVLMVSLCLGSVAQAGEGVDGKSRSVDPDLLYHDEMMALAKQRFAELAPEMLARGGEVYDLLQAYQAGEANLSDILSAIREGQQRIDQEVAPFQPWLESLSRGDWLLAPPDVQEGGASAPAPAPALTPETAGQSI